MKKVYAFLLLAGLSMCFSGCGRTEAAQQDKGITDTVAEQRTQVSEEQNLQSETEDPSRILIAYFTRADNIRIDPEVDATTSASISSNGSSYTGNLAIMADYIKDATGGDLFSIVTTEYYPTGYRDTTDTAKEEQNNDARPELSSHVEKRSSLLLPTKEAVWEAAHRK